MSRLLLLLALFVVCSAFSGAPGDYVYSVNRPEGARTFRVHVPRSYGAGPMPMLLAFHGLNDVCDKFDEKTGFLQLSESFNFILVYPCSTKGPIGTGWNAGTCCIQPTQIDDVAFARAIVAYMQSLYSIDSHRIWAAGFSNGAMMSETLACTSSDIFSAVGVVSGCTEMEPGNAGGLDKCDAVFGASGRLINVLHVHGNFDFIVPWNGDSVLGFPDTPTDMQRWANRVKCAGAPVQTFSNGTFSNQIWQQCAAGVHVELVKNDGGGHRWIRNGDFDTSVYILDYLFASSRPGS